MCVCIPPAAAPILLPLLEWLMAVAWALGPFVVPAVTVLVGALFLAVRGIARVAWLPIEGWLERRSDRLWNERMAAIHPHLRAQLPAAGRRRVDLSVVRPEPAELEAAAPLAIEPARPPAIRIYATPRKELTR